MQPINVLFHGHGHSSIIRPRSVARRSQRREPIIDLARKIQAHAAVESPFSSTSKAVEQAAIEALNKSKIVQEGVTRRRLLLQPTNIQGERPSVSTGRVDETDSGAIVKDTNRLMTTAVRQMYAILRESSMVEAQFHYKPKTNYFDSHLHLHNHVADPRLAVPMLTAGTMASDIRNYSLISRRSDLHELLTGAAAGGMIVIPTFVNPILLDVLGFQTGNNSIDNSISKKLQSHMASLAPTRASFSLPARLNQMVPRSTLKLPPPSLAGSMITEPNMFPRLLGISKRTIQPSHHLSSLALSRSVPPIAHLRRSLLPMVTNQLSNSALKAEVSSLSSAFSRTLDNSIIGKGGFQFDQFNNVFTKLLTGDNWMNVFVTGLFQSKSRSALWMYPKNYPSAPSGIGSLLLVSSPVEVSSALIRRISSYIGIPISNTLHSQSFDNSSMVNIIPAFSQFTDPVHEILGHAQALLLKYGAKQSDYINISTINQVKKLFDLSNLMMQKPLQVLKASNASTIIANIISPTLNFVGVRSKSDYYNKLQKAEDAYPDHISVAKSKSSAPIEKLIETSVLHTMQDFTIAPPLSRNVQTSSVRGQATVPHWIKSHKQSQLTIRDIDYRLTDYNINSNIIRNDVLASSDHPLQPTNFVNTLEELESSSNRDKHLEKIGKEHNRDSELSLLRTRIEHIFNREIGRHSDLQNHLVTDQFSLKYNDIVNENVVPDGKDEEHDEEMEIRALTRKIEQVLDEELRRYGPAIW